jgi:formylglycine-generating enzyme required for sulfatase activity
MSNLSAIEFEVVTINSQGQEIKRVKSSNQCQIKELGQGITLTMVAIPGGTFLMGSPIAEEGSQGSQRPQHLVSIDSFWMSQYPVTQAQWRTVAAFPQVKRSLNPEPSSFQGDNRPVEQISWHEAIEFCARLSAQIGDEYRLPSEAEWEYACRAHTQTPFHCGETIITDLANYSGIDWEYQGRICSKGSYGLGPKGEDRRETTPIDGFSVANPFGLFDLHGNVREWCVDHWHDNYENAPTDGTAWISGDDLSKRVLRGGSWNTGPRRCRSASRCKFDPEASLYDIGFRFACSSLRLS